MIQGQFFEPEELTSMQETYRQKMAHAFGIDWVSEGKPCPVALAIGHGHFTYAMKLWEWPANIYDHEMNRLRSNAGYVLLFEPTVDKRNFHTTAASIASLPLLQGLFPYGFCIAYIKHTDGKHIIVTDDFKALPHISTMRGHLFFVRKIGALARVYKVSISALWASCLKLERVVAGCAECEEAADTCLMARVTNWAHKENVDRSVFDFLERESPIDDMDTEDLRDVLQNRVSNDRWIFIPPSMTVSTGFVKSLRPVSEHPMDSLEDVRADRSESAKKSARTRAALKRCENECVIYNNCREYTESCKAGARMCQNKGDRYYKGGKKPTGPFTEQELLDAFWLFWHNKASKHTAKDMAFVAYNAGAITKALGRTLTLTKFSADLDSVEFVYKGGSYGYRDFETLEFSFEDTVKLLKIPRKDGNVYTYPGLEYPPRGMSEKELALYIDICQRDHLYCYNGRGGPCEPQVAEVSWDTDRELFYVEGRTGFGANISVFSDIQLTFREQPAALGYVEAIREMTETQRVDMKTAAMEIRGFSKESAGILAPHPESMLDKYP